MNRLADIRKERKLNMAQMAKLIGIPYTTYVSYEKDERHLNSDSLKLISGKLGVSADYIIGTSDKRISDTTKDVGYREEEYEEFKEILKQLSPDNAALLRDQALLILQHQKVQDGQ